MIHEDEACGQWLVSMEEIGLSFLHNAPATMGQLKKIVDRVSFVRDTNYGYVRAYPARRLPVNNEEGILQKKMSLYPTK